MVIRRFLLLFCISAFFKLNAQTLSNDTSLLYWSKDHRLTFDNFKGKPTTADTTAHEASFTMSNHKLGAIVKGIDVLLLTKRGKTIFTIRAAMKPHLSWIKDRGDTVELKHEQGHFDICELYARILRRDIKKARSLSEAKEIYEKTSSDEEVEHDKFDKENTYQAGGITAGWEQKIFNQLKALDDYKTPVVSLPIDK